MTHDGPGCRARRPSPRPHADRVRLGPGCNGATATARVLLAAGLDTRELFGGYEYWARNGFPTEADGVITRRTPDPLVTAEH